MSQKPLKFKKANQAELATLRSKIKAEEKQHRKYVLMGVGMLVFIIVFLIFHYTTYTDKPVKYNAKYDTTDKQAIRQEQEKKERAYNFYMKDGDRYFASGEYHNAIFQYSLAQDVFPGDYYSLYRQAYASCVQCQEQYKDCYSAKLLLDRLLKADPNKPELLKLKDMLEYEYAME